MRRVRVTLPAAAVNFGVAVAGEAGGIGLALGLYTTVDFIERSDDQLVVETAGEDAGRYGLSLRHPAVIGMCRVFQTMERAVLGVTVRIEASTPHALDLGAEAALYAAGVIGGNNLIGNPFRREDVRILAARASRQPIHTLTSILGGLNAVAALPDLAHPLLSTALPVASMRVILVLPQTAAERGRAPRSVSLADTQHNLSRLPLMLAALREGNYGLLAHTLADRVLLPQLQVAGYEIAQGVVEAFAASAHCVLTTVGSRDALLIFAEREHQRLADALAEAFDDAGLDARLWLLPMDTQGVIISLAQSG